MGSEKGKSGSLLIEMYRSNKRYGLNKEFIFTITRMLKLKLKLLKLRPKNYKKHTLKIQKSHNGSDE